MTGPQYFEDHGGLYAGLLRAEHEADNTVAVTVTIGWHTESLVGFLAPDADRRFPAEDLAQVLRDVADALDSGEEAATRDDLIRRYVARSGRAFPALDEVLQRAGSRPPTDAGGVSDAEAAFMMRELYPDGDGRPGAPS